MKWQPIETAPKDGMEFQCWLVTSDGHEFWEPRCKYSPEGILGVYGRIDYDLDGWDFGLWHLGATHWMPLPEPPKTDDR